MQKVIRTILGKIAGKTTTYEFEFIVDKLVEGKARKHEFLQVCHADYGFVLCQIVELVKDFEKTIAKCSVIGYCDAEASIIKPIRTPFMPGTEVLLAEDAFINDILKYDSDKGAYLGNLEYRNVPIYLNINKLVTKHTAILAKTGAGKSYTVGVLIEEMLDKGIPLLIIDPHGEYSTLKEPNQNPFEIEKMAAFNIKPRSYSVHIQEFGDININHELRPLKLNDNFTPQELTNLLPRLTSTQQAVLYSAIQDLDVVNFENLVEQLRFVDNNSKFTILSALDYLKKTNVFSLFPTNYNELIQVGKASLINLKGIEPDVQQIIVYKLLRDLFDLRKQNKISPFFCIIEEAHNFIPEKHISEARSSSVIRTIASEGRKFGMGLCIVSQRPALIEKNVLSQCNTQIILKITNPNDLKTITSSAEGLTYDAEDDIKNLPIGTAMVTGFVEMPVFATIRPRKSRHGGTAIVIVKEQEEPLVLIEEIAEDVNGKFAENKDETEKDEAKYDYAAKGSYDDNEDVENWQDKKEIAGVEELPDEEKPIAAKKPDRYITLDEFQKISRLEPPVQMYDDPRVENEAQEIIEESQQYVDEPECAVDESEEAADMPENFMDGPDETVDEPEEIAGTVQDAVAATTTAADKPKDVVDDVKSYKELMPLIFPKLSKKDMLLISPNPAAKVDTMLVPAALIKCSRKGHIFNILVELVSGRIIEDVDKFKTMDIIDLSKFSVAEIQVLEAGLHLYTFTESMLTPKTGLSITKVQNVLNLLYNDCVIDKNEEYYTISHPATLISHPQDYAYNGDVKYESVDFTEKEEKIKTIGEIKNKLAQFVDVVDTTECFIVKYEVVC